MRHFILLSAITLFSFSSVLAQTCQLDSLFENINNHQIILARQTFYNIQMRSPAGESLINLGTLASDKLFNLLDDTCKGIIAHYLLCRIWAGKLPGFSDTLRTTILYTRNLHIRTDYLINHCGLNYSVDTNNITTATKEQLMENKNIWQQRLRIEAVSNKALVQAAHNVVTWAFGHIQNVAAIL